MTVQENIYLSVILAMDEAAQFLVAVEEAVVKTIAAVDKVVHKTHPINTTKNSREYFILVVW